MKVLVNGKTANLTGQQEKFLKLLYKFRYVTIPELATLLKIRNDSTYDVLETLKRYGLVNKIYTKEYRIDRKPACYRLSPKGVTTVRKLLNVPESVVHALYKKSSTEFMAQCQLTLVCYNLIRPHLPPDTDMFTRTEINRQNEFPKNKPDLYIRTPNDREAMVYIMTEQPKYIINKRIDEIITHSEEKGWHGVYPTVAFVLKDKTTKKSFIHKTKNKLEGIGMDEDDLRVLTTDLDSILSKKRQVWEDLYTPSELVNLASDS